MIDLICSKLSNVYSDYMRQSIKKHLEISYSNPAIILYPENALRLDNYQRPKSQHFNVNGLEKLVFFCFTQARTDPSEKDFAVPYGCVFDGQNSIIFPRYIDIGGRSLADPNYHLIKDYSPEKEAEYQEEREYPLFEIDGRKIEFRVCWDVWARTSNKPDLVIVSAQGFSHSRGSPEGRREFRSEHPVIINDGKEKGITVYNEGKRFDGQSAIEIANDLGLNVYLPVSAWQRFKRLFLRQIASNISKQ